jgi:adenine deaminase
MHSLYLYSDNARILSQGTIMINKSVFMLLAFLVHSAVSAEPRLVIKNGTLIDAINPDRRAMTIIIQGDTILSIEPAATAPLLLDDDRVIDAEGKFVIPGLWDAHVHMTFIPDLDYKTSYDLFLKNGITSIRYGRSHCVDAACH